MRVIGTAGHVDHGKSTLVKALTGIDPDRLKEEKEREMTIDLGFAWLTLPSGMVVSIVDVPGHEAFIKNMLAGVGGIDAAMLVIAADEGVMPQTLEHVAILDLLQVKGGLVALTKIDVLPDREWIDLVSADVSKELADTVLANAKIIPVSAKTRAGLDVLLSELDRLLQVVSPKSDFGRPRLPIDRVFSLAGFGTVVTGTLIDGAFSIGQEVEIIPGGKRGRIRGLQTHKEKIDRAMPGRRLAMNLSGLRVEELSRGQVVALPGTIKATTLVDARLQYLASAPKPLIHNAEVDFFVGSAQVPARMRLIDHEQLKPGHRGWVQLHLAQPVALAKNDRFIIRFASPSLTIGGGSIVEPHARTRYRRFRPDVVARLETLARGTPEEIVSQFLSTRGTNPADVKEIANGTGLSVDQLTPILNAQIQSGAITPLGTLGTGYFLSAAGWRALAENIVMAREDVLRQPDFRVAFNTELKMKIDALLAQFEKSPYAAPSAQEAGAAIGVEALNALIAQEKLVRLNESVLLSPQALQTMKDWVVATIRKQGQVTAAQVRDQFDTSRKYAIALLEYLDEKR